MLVRVMLATTAAVLIAAGSANASVNLVNDGTFTAQTGVSSSFKTYYKGATFGGWKVIGAAADSVDLVNPAYFAAPDVGQRSVDLNGFVAGGISQVTNLVAPGSYVLSFWLSANPNAPRDAARNTPRTLDVSIGSVVNDLRSYTLGNSNSKNNMNYTLETVSFTYDGTPAGKVLSFLSTSDTGRYGPVIGDVEINAVPEPAAWAMMLIGFGGLGATLRMNRRRAFAAA